MMPHRLAAITCWVFCLVSVGCSSSPDGEKGSTSRLFNNKKLHDMAKHAPSARRTPTFPSHIPRKTSQLVGGSSKQNSNDQQFSKKTLAFPNRKRLSEKDYSFVNHHNNNGFIDSAGPVFGNINKETGILARNTNDRKSTARSEETDGAASGVPMETGDVHTSDVGQWGRVTGGDGTRPESSITHHRQKRGFRSAVADRIAHGFGKRTHPTVYNSFTSVADLLARDYIADDSRSDRQTGIPIVELAKQFHDDQTTLVDYISSYIDVNGDGVIDLKELLGDQ